VIVHHDADLSLAAERVAVGGYSFSGQTCISVQRIYAHQDVYEDFLAELVERVEQLTTGDPSDPATDVSSLIDSGETERVASVVEEALDGGADLVTGGSASGSSLIEPTVLAGVRDEMAVCRTEVFGPVVGVRTYLDIESAFEAANDTRYGLQAGIFTRGVSTALEGARRLDFGGVCVNEVPTFRADQMPYGGVRDSGNTKEGPAWAVREMTEERMVVIQL
jgi:acyl-CoA reductase-like NAD-dependent aldehyde dehydrogenase